MVRARGFEIIVLVSLGGLRRTVVQSRLSMMRDMRGAMAFTNKVEEDNKHLGDEDTEDSSLEERTR